MTFRRFKKVKMVWGTLTLVLGLNLCLISESHGQTLSSSTANIINESTPAKKSSVKKTKKKRKKKKKPERWTKEKSQEELENIARVVTGALVLALIAMSYNRRKKDHAALASVARSSIQHAPRAVHIHQHQETDPLVASKMNQATADAQPFASLPATSEDLINTSAIRLVSPKKPGEPQTPRGPLKRAAGMDAAALPVGVGDYFSGLPGESVYWTGETKRLFSGVTLRFCVTSERLLVIEEGGRFKRQDQISECFQIPLLDIQRTAVARRPRAEFLWLSLPGLGFLPTGFALTMLGLLLYITLQKRTLSLTIQNHTIYYHIPLRLREQLLRLVHQAQSDFRAKLTEKPSPQGRASA